MNPDYQHYLMEGLSFDAFDAFAGILTDITGIFTPFDDAELEERYPNYRAYMNQVASAAEHLYEDGYIVEEDNDACIREAAQRFSGRPDRRNRR